MALYCTSFQWFSLSLLPAINFPLYHMAIVDLDLHSTALWYCCKFATSVVETHCLRVVAFIGRRMTGEVGVAELIQGGASTGNATATAAAGTLPALPTATTAVAAAAAAAIAGLGARALGEGAVPSKPGASHLSMGLSYQKQVTPVTSCWHHLVSAGRFQ